MQMAQKCKKKHKLPNIIPLFWMSALLAFKLCSNVNLHKQMGQFSIIFSCWRIGAAAEHTSWVNRPGISSAPQLVSSLKLKEIRFVYDFKLQSGVLRRKLN